MCNSASLYLFLYFPELIMVKLLICGGGNGAHVYSGVASSQPGCEVRVLTLYAVSPGNGGGGDVVCHVIAHVVSHVVCHVIAHVVCHCRISCRGSYRIDVCTLHCQTILLAPRCNGPPSYTIL